MLDRFLIWNRETSAVLEMNYVCLDYIELYVAYISNMEPSNWCCATSEFCLLTLHRNLSCLDFEHATMKLVLCYK